uniref:Uncharacterized protein n=1 Tax=Globodera pallida TaxID=36090 RepID=A0A183BRY2_GLOPA
MPNQLTTAMTPSTEKNSMLSRIRRLQRRLYKSSSRGSGTQFPTAPQPPQPEADAGKCGRRHGTANVFD